MRMRWPSWIPGGAAASSGRSSVFLLVPLQSGHGVATTSPAPAHCGQVRVRMNCPKIDDETDCSRPLPPHAEHVSGLVPGAAPVALQVEHGTATGNGTSLLTPLAASSS